MSDHNWVVSAANQLAGNRCGPHDQPMFTAFVLIVAVAFVFIVAGTYYRRWRNDRGRIDPGANERSRAIRAKDAGQPAAGPHNGPPNINGSGSF
jgi:hypothetical protein